MVQTNSILEGIMIPDSLILIKIYHPLGTHWVLKTINIHSVLSATYTPVCGTSLFKGPGKKKKKEGQGPGPGDMQSLRPYPTPPGSQFAF